MTVRLQASIQSLVFVVVQAATLFGAAGLIDIVEFWVYVAILAAGLFRGFTGHDGAKPCALGC
jgi:hypothetical protein